ncbi:MAG: hypothetical protein FWC00_02045 [Firmicutes bacterium]|nr:hypothetical protein [Bacillota bacterium]
MEKNKGRSVPIKNEAMKQELKSRVICKTCGKDIEFTKTVKMHSDCPRCNTPLDRDFKAEQKSARHIINYDFLKTLRRYYVFIALVLVSVAIAFNVSLFFSLVIQVEGWWIALCSLPLVAISVWLSCKSIRFKSKTKMLRICSWCVFVLNIVAIILIIITSIPQVNYALYNAI